MQKTKTKSLSRAPWDPSYMVALCGVVEYSVGQGTGCSPFLENKAIFQRSVASEGDEVSENGAFVSSR